MNDSSTGGYLLPASSPTPLQGQSLTRFLQQFVVGITGLPGQLVRPRWQAAPVVIPPEFTCWCAFGITSVIPDPYGFDQFQPGTAGGQDNFQRHETLNLIASFYDTGVNGEADMYASQLNDGLLIAQNREVLTLAGMGLLNTGNPTPVPSLEKERWLYKVDFPFAIRRQKRRVYPVLNLLSAQAALIIDEPNRDIPIIVSQ